MTTASTLTALAAAIQNPSTYSYAEQLATYMSSIASLAGIGYVQGQFFPPPTSAGVPAPPAPPVTAGVPVPPVAPVTAAALSAAAVAAGATLTPAVAFPATVSDWPNAFGQAYKVRDAIASQYGTSPPDSLASFVAMIGLLPGQANTFTDATDPFNVGRLGSAAAWFFWEQNIAGWIQIASDCDPSEAPFLTASQAAIAETSLAAVIAAANTFLAAI